MAGKVGVAWIITPFALMLSLSIAGIGLDGRFGANSLCRRPRFLHAVVVGKSASEVCDSLRSADRAGGGLADIDSHQFLRFRRRAGNFPDDAVARGCLAVGSFLVRVCRASAICSQERSGRWTLRPRYSGVCRVMWISDYASGNRAGIFSRQANHFRVEV